MSTTAQYGSDLEREFVTHWNRFSSSYLPQPEKERRFHPTRKWRFDFAWPDQKVAVELHGGTYAHGRHTRGPGFDKDREKINAAQMAGWIVLEYSSRVLRDDPAQVIEQVSIAIQSRM